MKNLEKEVKTFVTSLPKYVTKVNFILIGNSLIAGYRRRGKIKKLFFKQNMISNIKEIFEKYNIEFCIYDFSRPQDNGNRRIFELLVNNVDLDTINKLSIDDVTYLQELNKDTSYICKDDMYMYQSQNIHINDLLKNGDRNTYTAILLGGCTGRILETFFKEKFPKNLKIFKAFFEDLNYLKEILDYLLFINPNIPVFVTGFPEIKCLTPLINFGNKKIEEICTKNFNAIFFNFGNKKLKYNYLDETFLDLHPDEEESKNFVTNLFKALNNNTKKYMVSSNLYQLLRRYNLFNYDKEFSKDEFEKFLLEQKKYFDSKTLKKAMKYFYDYYIKEKVHDFHGTNFESLFNVIL